MKAISDQKTGGLCRNRLRLRVVWLTIAFWGLHLAVTCGRVGLTSTVELSDVLPRLAAFTAVSLLLSPIFYAAVERLRKQPLHMLAPGALALAAVGGLANSAVLVLGYAIATGHVHPDGDPTRFPTVAAYWMWIYLAWELAVIALLLRDDNHADVFRPAKRQFRNREIWVNHRNGRIRVALSSILWIEAAGDYVVLHSTEGDFMTHASLNALELQLEPREFIRVHRSSIINLNAVTGIRSNTSADFRLQLSNGVWVRVGRTFKKAVRSALRLGGH